MKIQVALDRVSLERGIEIAKKAESYVDIIEIGTSLIKDYGLEAIRQIRAVFPGKAILADYKTMDEGEYEFRAAFDNGADIATVMGVASWPTLEACYRVAKEYSRDLMIDLMETSWERVAALQTFEEAIFCFHTPRDAPKGEIDRKLGSFCANFPGIRRLAVAGGIKLNDISLLHAFPVEIVIIGSTISKAVNPAEAAQRAKQAARVERGVE